VTHAEVEPRVGGRYRIWHADAGADVGGFDCELVELEQDRRFVWRWGGRQLGISSVILSLLQLW
jgi:uncharacterized protein YndB with AHSA1/START domain